MRDLIKETTLRALVEANSIRQVVALGQSGGFAVAFHYGAAESELGNARGGIRVFPNLTTLAAFLVRMGIPRFEVDATAYQKRRSRARPDRAEALKKTRTKPRQAALSLEQHA
jgi:hypothetical protein